MIEYKTIYVSKSLGQAELDAELNLHGKDNWELVSQVSEMYSKPPINAVEEALWQVTGHYPSETPHHKLTFKRSK
jgi:hypothetical protein